MKIGEEGKASNNLNSTTGKDQIGRNNKIGRNSREGDISSGRKIKDPGWSVPDIRLCAKAQHPVYYFFALHFIQTEARRDKNKTLAPKSFSAA